MSIGWIKLHRAVLNSQVFMNEGLFKVWVYCLLRANHEPCWVPINTGKGTTEVKVEAGQFIYGRLQASKDLRMKPSSVRNRMEKLKNIGNLDILTDSHFSIVTICNWSSYQEPEKDNGQQKGQAKDKLRTTKGQAKDTDKNDKNVKNDKNTIVTAIADDVPNASDFETWQSSIRVAEHLLNSICEYDPTHKYNHNPPSIAGWVKDIDLAIRKDKRTEEQMVFLIDAIFKHPHRFPDLWDKWATNIESGGKLRSKFDQIKNQIRSSGKSTEQKITETERFLSTYQHG